MTASDAAVVSKFLAEMPEDWVAVRRDDEASNRFAERIAPLLHPDFELVAPQELAGLGVPSGVGQVNDLYGDWLDTFESYRERWTDVIDAGPGTVLVLATVGGRTATDDVEITREVAAVHTVEECLIRRVQLFFDVDEARAAAGL